jgi:antitoxin (DNA-binding transcriptional repressor) of toxin-antitoxin stability system
VKEISQRELRNDSGAIMRGLDAGESYVVTRNGQPVGQLLPLRRQRFVKRAAIRELFRGAPALDAAAFRADLDRAVDQDIEPRA